MNRKRILIIAGGTGGHIFPALAVARVLRNQGYDLHWLGSHVGMEKALVGEEFPMTMISIKAIRGKSLSSKLLSPFRLCIAIWQAWREIKRLNPDLVIGMGGFVSGPGGIAARFAKKPLVIHEQNAIAGLTNRLLSKHAKVVLQGFPDAFPSTIPAETIGNPVRPAIAAIPSPIDRFVNRVGPLRVFIVGGSQGARTINQTIVRVLSQYPKPQTLNIWHQTGQLDFQLIQQAYQNITTPAKIEAFIDNISAAYAWADLLICRAGALTISEIAAAGVASILIPFPYAVDNHQYYNGVYLSKAGAAEIILEREISDDDLIQRIEKFADDRPRLVAMAIRARSLAKPEALSKIVSICDRLTA